MLDRSRAPACRRAQRLGSTRIAVAGGGFRGLVLGPGHPAIATAPALQAAAASSGGVLRVRLRRERDAVGELGDRDEVAGLGELRQPSA